MEVRVNPLDPPCLCTQSPGTFDSNLSNVAKIAAIHLVFTVCILRNSYKWCALIITLFTMDGVISMEMECLWWFLGVHGTQIRPKDGICAIW